MTNDNMHKQLADALSSLELDASKAVAAFQAGVWDAESPPAVFLRHAKGHVSQAAERMAYYWEERASIFQEDYLKPVSECLTKEHRAWLAKDIAVLLPGTDKQGRRVLLATTHQGLGTEFAQALLLCRFVAFQQVMLEEQELVFVRVANPDSQFDIKLAQRSQHAFRCFPIDIRHIRILCAGPRSYIQNTLLPTVFGGLGKEWSQLCKTHMEPELVRMQPHLSDILAPHQLPLWLGGTWNRQQEEQAMIPSDEDLVPLILEMIEHVADADLEQTLGQVLQQCNHDTRVDECVLQDICETIRIRRATAQQASKRLALKVQLVFGVAHLLVEEMPAGSKNRLTNLLQDDLADEILRDLWVSTPPSTVPLHPPTGDAIDDVVESILQLFHHQSDQPLQHKKDPTDPLQETQWNHVHAKFRSALKLLSLLENDHALGNQEWIAMVCQLVELPFPTTTTTSSQTEQQLDRLADLWVQQQPLLDDDDMDSPDWLVRAVTAASCHAPIVHPP